MAGPLQRAAAIAALALCLAAPGRSARADDADVCMTAPVEGQQLQKAGKLLAARQKFTACARKTCPAEIVHDCTRWAGEVEAALPTFVMAARDESGHDLADVTVSIDGQPPVPISARSISVDPGSHKFVFRRTPAAGASSVSRSDREVDQTTILRDGEKNREIVASFHLRAEAKPAAVVSERPVPAGAWVSGVFGVAGFGVFGVAGALGVSDRRSEHCDTGCPQAQKTGVDNLLRVADLGLGIGVVGVSVATWLFLARPTRERPASGAALSAPFVDLRPTTGGGVAVVGGTF